MLLVALCIFNYVVNIGFSRDWHRFPVFISVAVFALLALASYFITSSPSSPILGIPIVIWLAYFYAHLGISFVLAAILATPGCEMRAIPQLFNNIKGRHSMEHHCPSSIISGIDNWERTRLGNK